MCYFPCGLLRPFGVQEFLRICAEFHAFPPVFEQALSHSRHISLCGKRVLHCAKVHEEQYGSSTSCGLNCRGFCRLDQVATTFQRCRIPLGVSGQDHAASMYALLAKVESNGRLSISRPC